MRTERILQSTPLAIEEGIEVLKSGGLVGFPTETVYGLGRTRRMIRRLGIYLKSKGVRRGIR